MAQWCNPMHCQALGAIESSLSIQNFPVQIYISLFLEYNYKMKSRSYPHLARQQPNLLGIGIISIMPLRSVTYIAQIPGISMWQIEIRYINDKSGYPLTTVLNIRGTLRITSRRGRQDCIYINRNKSMPTSLSALCRRRVTGERRREAT